MLDRVADAIPAVPLTKAEREAVLGIALLSIAADHEVHERELTALRAVATKLGAADEAERELAALRVVARDEADARLLELASWLTTPGSHVLAYKVAYAMSLADSDAADGEFEFDLQLIDALGLAQAQVDTSVAEVEQALGRK